MLAGILATANASTPIVPTLADRFDALLTNRCIIYLKVGAPVDSYGIGARSLSLVEINVHCRLSTLGSGRENVAPIEAGIADFEIFMREREYTLTKLHSIKIDLQVFDIVSVIPIRNRASQVNHLQVYVKEVLP